MSGVVRGPWREAEATRAMPALRADARGAVGFAFVAGVLAAVAASLALAGNAPHAIGAGCAAALCAGGAAWLTRAVCRAAERAP